MAFESSKVPFKKKKKRLNFVKLRTESTVIQMTSQLILHNSAQKLISCERLNFYRATACLSYNSMMGRPWPLSIGSASKMLTSKSEEGNSNAIS
jgi:hypothetical protein